jgi:hypothetical protein
LYDAPSAARGVGGARDLLCGALKIASRFTFCYYSAPFMSNDNPLAYLERLHHEERQLLAVLDTPQHSLERRVQIEHLLRLVRTEIAEVMARNVDVAGEA